jgi:hypothetical protein
MDQQSEIYRGFMKSLFQFCGTLPSDPPKVIVNMFYQVPSPTSPSTFLKFLRNDT